MSPSELYDCLRTCLLAFRESYQPSDGVAGTQISNGQGTTNRAKRTAEDAVLKGKCAPGAGKKQTPYASSPATPKSVSSLVGRPASPPPSTSPRDGSGADEAADNDVEANWRKRNRGDGEAKVEDSSSKQKRGKQPITPACLLETQRHFVDCCGRLGDNYCVAEAWDKPCVVAKEILQIKYANDVFRCLQWHLKKKFGNFPTVGDSSRKTGQAATLFAYYHGGDQGRGSQLTQQDIEEAAPEFEKKMNRRKPRKKRTNDNNGRDNRNE